MALVDGWLHKAGRMSIVARARPAKPDFDYRLTLSGADHMTDVHEDLKEQVEDLGGITIIRGGGKQRQWNNIQYKQGLSGKNTSAKALSMNVAMIPPSGLQGRVRHEYGKGLRQSVENEAGDFIFIEPGVPHEVFNVSDTEPVIAIVSRSSAAEWDNIVSYDRNSE
jgi:hypothetical protein